MEKINFLYDEILAMTAGKLALTKTKGGVSIRFIEYFLKRINQYILLENENVQFVLPYSLEDENSLFYTMHSSTYVYDNIEKVFKIKRGMWHDFFAHWEFAEYRVIEALSRKSINNLSNKEIMDFQEKARKLLNKVFHETKENFY